jgi:hypothetical protein
MTGMCHFFPVCGQTVLTTYLSDTMVRAFTRIMVLPNHPVK